MMRTKYYRPATASDFAQPLTILPESIIDHDKASKEIIGILNNPHLQPFAMRRALAANWIRHHFSQYGLQDAGHLIDAYLIQVNAKKQFDAGLPIFVPVQPLDES